MHILFTRPFDDCHELMLRFKSLGHMVSHIPVISIQKIIYESLDFSLFKGIIFTSSNAIKFLDTQKIDKQIKCFCVGNVTEKVAKTKGFQNIYVAGGNVENLKEIIFQNFEASDGNLIYVTGEIISSDLDKKLISEGYNLKRIINYKAIAQEKFNNDEIEKLKVQIVKVDNKKLPAIKTDTNKIRIRKKSSNLYESEDAIRSVSNWFTLHP